MADDDTRQVDISLLGRDYRVACPAGHEGKLMEAALLLDGRMREIQEAGKLLGAEKIAIMAALNIAHDFLFSTDSKGFDLHEARRRIREIDQRLDRCFFEQDSLF
jgi:cell division protein ZapA